MIGLDKQTSGGRNWTAILVVLGVLAGAVLLGATASILWLVLIVAGVVGVLLLQRPVLGLPLLILAALLVPIEIGTGSAVVLNTVTMLIPVLLGIWLLSMLLRRDVGIYRTPANTPLALFLLASFFSLLIGNALWSAEVPRESSFIIVQLAQWAIFVFAAGAFWLVGNLTPDYRWLKRLTFLFLVVAGGLALIRLIPGAQQAIIAPLATGAIIRAPFWIMLGALALGQLMFNKDLHPAWAVFLLLSLVGVFVYAIVQELSALSNWIGLGAVIAVLMWLRWPKLRWPAMIAIFLLLVSGVLLPFFWDAAGGEDEWAESGGSRLALTERVIEVTMHNPITGLGPAAYRPYARVEPLPYRNAVWFDPQVSSHNNYVDLFSHAGIVGLLLFFWFAVEMGKLGVRLRKRYQTGFESGFVNGMLAAGAGALVLMALADWILPFVYNIGFFGFQASVLVWIFLGGLVALDRLAYEAGEVEGLA